MTSVLVLSFLFISLFLAVPVDVNREYHVLWDEADVLVVLRLFSRELDDERRELVHHGVAFEDPCCFKHLIS